MPNQDEINEIIRQMAIIHKATLQSSEEDKFWYDESEKGLEFSNEEFWKDIYGKNDAKDNL